MKFSEWLKDPWQVECYKYCPHSYDGGCSICEKLGNKKPEENCYNCRDFLDFGGELKDDRYTCYPGICGLCKKDMGLIANPYRECLADALERQKQ